MLILLLLFLVGLVIAFHSNSGYLLHGLHALFLPPSSTLQSWTDMAAFDFWVMNLNNVGVLLLTS